MKISEYVMNCPECASELCSEDRLYTDSKGNFLGCELCIRQYYDERFDDFLRTLYSHRVGEQERQAE